MRFTQIAATPNAVYALDSSGQVWVTTGQRCDWDKMLMPREEDKHGRKNHLHR